MANVVCAKCKVQFPASTGLGTNELSCEKCGCRMRCDLVRIRAKRSRAFQTGFARTNREFNVRVIDAKGERLIQFIKGGWDDYEMRSKDEVIFTYLKGELKLVQNLKVNLFYEIEKPVDSVRVILFAIIIFIGFIAFIGFVASSGRH